MTKRRRQLITSDRAIRSKGVQHTQPCSDCPFARGALPGWLGGLTVGWRQWCKCGLCRDVDVQPFASHGPWRKLAPAADRLDRAIELLTEARAHKGGWWARVDTFLRGE